jgi:hypothetical protein
VWLCDVIHLYKYEARFQFTAQFSLCTFTHIVRLYLQRFSLYCYSVSLLWFYFHRFSVWIHSIFLKNVLTTFNTQHLKDHWSPHTSISIRIISQERRGSFSFWVAWISNSYPARSAALRDKTFGAVCGELNQSRENSEWRLSLQPFVWMPEFPYWQ